MEILYLPKFARHHKKLSKEVKILAEKKEKIFRLNPFDVRLKTHKLSGELDGFYSFSINYSYRIIFDFADKNKKIARFYTVGKHNFY